MPTAKADPGIDAEAHLQERGRVGAGAEEGGVAERELAAEAAEDVPALRGERDDEGENEEVQDRVRRE